MSNLNYQKTLNPINNNANVKNKADSPAAARFFEITGRTELLEWVVENKTISLLEQTQNERDENKTFRDENGILRYKKNWLPAAENGVISSYESIYFETGCGDISFLLKAPNLNSTIATLKILLDWERLWWHFATDSSDELANHGFLLRASLGFFMHEKTILFFWLLMIYTTLVQIWQLSYYSDQLFSVMLFVMNNLISSFIYWILRRLYVGTNNRMGKNIDEQEILLQQQQSDRFSSHAAPTMHWRGAVRRYLVLMYSELVLLFTRNPCARKPSSRKPCSKRQVVTSFDHLLNIALKYVTQHCGISSQDVNLNRRGYKLAFLSLFTVLPVFCLLKMVREWQNAISVCSELGQGSVACQNYIIAMVLTMGSLTSAVISYLLFGTLIVSIIGLTFGTELAYHMTEWWIRRYVGLRKVSVKDDGLESHIEVGAVHQNATITVEALEDGPVPNGDEQLSLSEVASYLKTDAVEQYLFLVEYMRQCGVIWSAVIVGLYMYATVMGLVSGYYVTSYVLYPTSGTAFQDVMFILPFIFQCLLFFIFPALSLAHANSLIAPLLEVFANSSRDDFSMLGMYLHLCMYVRMVVCVSNHNLFAHSSLCPHHVSINNVGGKDMWLEFVNSLPAAWTVCGVWITYNRIFGFISTALTAAGTALITFLLSGTFGGE